MQINPQTGKLLDAKWIASPNFDARPANTSLDLIVIHGISLPPRKFGGVGVEQLFTNKLNPDEDPFYAEIADLKVSAHLFIRRDGEIIQFVSFNDRAWHAGLSSFKGREKCNDFSIGIELEGTDDLAYETVQYTQLNKVIAALQQAYPSLADNKVVGHSDIAPGRKTDPGKAFDWAKIESISTKTFT